MPPHRSFANGNGKPGKPADIAAAETTSYSLSIGVDPGQYAA